MTVTGKRRALLVGINYVGTSAELRGCINDINNQKKFLIDHYGFAESDIKCLSEDEPKENWPYKANMIAGFQWLYAGAKSGDLLFFQYSGHGSQFSQGGSLMDCLCPLDCIDKAWPDSIVLDVEVHKYFYDPLPPGCKAVAIFDCCHSGTIANLPIFRELSSDQKPKPRYMKPPATANVAVDNATQPLAGIRKGVVSGKYDDHQLWVFSGCQDNQTSADAWAEGSYQGAFTWAFLKSLSKDSFEENYLDLIEQVKTTLSHYTQIPALTTTRKSYLDYWYLGRQPAPAPRAVMDFDKRGGSRKKALMVGINYRDTPNELRGCINDVNNQKAVLMKHYGFTPSEMLMLTEDEEKKNWPYKARIIEGLTWLMKDAADGDTLFFHYSGHGSQMTDRTGTEPSGMSDCICPLDCDKPWPAHIILDTEIHTHVYDQLPANVRLVCIFDCCHSGTVANLEFKREFVPVTVDSYEASRFMQPPADVSTPAPPSASMLSCMQGGPAPKTTSGFRRAVAGGDTYGAKHVWVFSGCQDDQTSADAYEGGQYQGAFSWALIGALQDNRYTSRYGKLLKAIRHNLRYKYRQVPALSTTSAAYFDRYYLAKVPVF